jgi:hypothetical protein
VLDSDLMHVVVPFHRRKFPPLSLQRVLLDLGAELTFNQCNISLDCGEHVRLLLEEREVNLLRVGIIAGVRRHIRRATPLDDFGRRRLAWTTSLYIGPDINIPDNNEQQGNTHQTRIFGRE